MKIFNRKKNGGRESAEDNPQSSSGDNRVVFDTVDLEAIDLLKNDPEEFFRRSRRP